MSSYYHLHRDNVRAEAKAIDYVIVVDKAIQNSKFLRHIVNFIEYLQKLGLKVQVNYGTIPENIYICLHIPQNRIHYFADIYDLDIDNAGHNFIPMSSLGLPIFRTALTKKRDIFKRERGASSMERILLMYQILNEAKFGVGEDEYGIGKLIRLNIVKAAYPLHDGPYHFDDEDDAVLNDRQILHKYWANFSMWYKEQPLNIIEKYYGAEVAFYFAWLGFYNKMLVPAAIIGVICFFISVIQLIAVHNERAEDICLSEKMLCPLCHSGDSCLFQPLNDSCLAARFIVIFDNYAAVAFAIFMSFWATVFLNLWRRFENVLKIRWNVANVETQVKVRVQFKERATGRRLSLITGRVEPYMPTTDKAIFLTISYGTCLLFVAVVVLACFGVIMYRIIVAAYIRATTSGHLESIETLLLVCSSAIIHVIMIKLFGKTYAKLSQWLTELENPRTQEEFDSAVVYKRYFLGFANNYASLIYNAFIKGRLYSPVKKSTQTGIETDICHPCGCLMSVCIQLCFLLVLKSLIGNIATIFMPKITKRFKKTKTEVVPPWEEDFKLEPAGRYLLTTEFMEMIIQYGFVTFFVAAFPLAPLFALFINCIELRLDANKLITRYRRPVPKRQSGIGPWNNILLIITHLSVATNAFVLAFTSDFVPREIYKYDHNGSLDNYIDAMFSLYDMKDYNEMNDENITPLSYNNSTLCYYKSIKYPPDHPKKYQFQPQYWYEIGMRLVCVIVFEHVIWVTNGILAYFIPDVPQQVRQKIHHEAKQQLDMKLKLLAEQQKVRQRKKPRLDNYQNQSK